MRRSIIKARVNSRLNMESINVFIKNLSHQRYPHVFNPWLDTDTTWDISSNAAKVRQDRLRLHLDNPMAKYCLIGEAPGYQGCRMSGCAFTSERLIYEGAIPRLERYSRERMSTRGKPFTEPSATVVWNAVQELGIAKEIILWNAFAWHPMGDRALSNRTPDNKEFKAGLPILEEFLSLIASINKNIMLIAVGQNAKTTLSRLGVSLDGSLRHPAYGGAREFRRGLHDCIVSECE